MEERISSVDPLLHAGLIPSRQSNEYWFERSSPGRERVLNGWRYGQVLSALNDSIGFQAAQFVGERSAVYSRQQPAEFTKPLGSRRKGAK